MFSCRRKTIHVSCMKKAPLQLHPVYLWTPVEAGDFVHAVARRRNDRDAFCVQSRPEPPTLEPCRKVDDPQTLLYGDTLFLTHF